MTESVFDNETGDMDAVISTAVRATTPKVLEPDQVASVIVPAGASLEILDLERFQPAPRRASGTYRPATVAAFVDYLKRVENASTTVWVHPTTGGIVALVNDHAPELPAWRDHKVELRLQVPPEWAYWLAQDGKMLGQEDFAEHIEGGLDEIVAPDAASMMEIAQTFQAATSAQFRSSTRLQSGEQRLQYDEEIKAAAGTTGQLDVPTELELGIAPFVGEEKYRLKARLRFRVRAGSLALGYKLDRPDAVVRDALSGIASRLGEQFPNTYLGEPPVA